MTGEERPEIVFALIGATGSPLHTVARGFEQGLEEFGYETSQIKLIDLVAGATEEGLSKAELLDRRMTLGSDLRRTNGRGDALALLATREIKAIRRAAAKVGERAYILTSLKNPRELATLRAVYGSRLVAVGAHCPKRTRLEYLVKRLSGSGLDSEDVQQLAERFIERDADEGDPLGQNIDATFHEADCFVEVGEHLAEGALSHQIERLLRVIFGDPFQTPTREERGMFMAAGAAAQSAELTRQVGASVMRNDGSIISVGCNEVPRFGGGVYWEGDDPDHREFTRKHDSAAAARTELAEAIAEELRGRLGIDPAIAKDDLTGEIAAGLRGVTEFGRAAHAEMTALFSAAAAEASVVGATVLTTTFPCHTCTRYMLTAGIRRVVYVSPYVRSWAARLYPEAIEIEPVYKDGDVQRMRIEPFTGVAPRRYLEFFGRDRWVSHGKYPRRSDETGRVLDFDPGRALPLLIDDPSEDLGFGPPAFLRREEKVVELSADLEIPT